MYDNEDSFFITLVSNSSTCLHAKNTPSCFTNKLAKRIDCSEDTEVALMEIHLPYSLMNVYDGNSRAWVLQGDNFISRCILKDDHYTDIPTVLKILEKELKGTYGFEMTDGFVNCSAVADDEFTLKLTRTLAMQLGFPNSTEFTSNEFRAPSKPDFNVGIPSHALIYCDIVKPQIVGNTMKQLLRSITINTRKYMHGGHTHITFSHPLYLPVNIKEIDQISVDIKDSDGKSLPFISGTSTVLLHFRRHTD